MKKYDATIVGSGPNGFAAAIRLQLAGLSTLLVEGSDKVGGGMRTSELTLPGYHHDVCSAVHPMFFGSPFFDALPLADYDLKFVEAKYPLAHPLDDAPAVLLHRSMEKMADVLGADFSKYQALLSEVVYKWPLLAADVFGPLQVPHHPLLMAEFGLKALASSSYIAKRFERMETRALWAGLVAHGMQPLDRLGTSAIGLVLGGIAHRFGWPIPVGGSQAIANALAAYYQDLGGKILLNHWLEDVKDLPPHELLFLNMSPKQILQVKGLELKAGYRQQLEKYRYGMGVFKIDWALSDPTPFRDLACQQAATVHLGGSFEEIAASELDAFQGRMNAKPYVLFSQPSVFDSSRAPTGKHTGWAYCHVPHGSEQDCTELIESQVERFAPGFRDTILGRHTMNAQQMESYNPNYVGGDISGGIMDLGQMFTRPNLSLTPYRTSNPKVYITSSSTPPGGGVHGMCGYHAAHTALKDHYSPLK
ncbi:phytoene desaturase family protein [Sphingobacterium kyonggiense]